VAPRVVIAKDRSNPRSASRAQSPTARPAKRRSSEPRTRRSAEEARRRILEAAEKQLMKVGPEGLRLTDLAKTLRISHPAILHHFGSREGLVAAVVLHSQQALSAQLLAALNAGKTEAGREQLIEMVAEVCGQRGLARLVAWLLLSGRASKLPRATELPLKQLADAIHPLQRLRNPSARYEDVMFELQLLATVLLGDALFGDAIRRASGQRADPRLAREFRARLAKLLPH
jgi:AcrR family transcriptional regulator